MTQSSDREKRVNEEIENKVRILDSDSYDFGPPLSKVSISLIFIIAVISILGLIWGGL